MIIRKAQSSDFYKHHLQLLSQLTDTPQLYYTIYRSIVEYNNIFVIEDEYRIIATATLLVEWKLIHGGRKVAHIEDFVVDNNYRGKGIGKKMINFLVNRAKEEGCYKIILNCVPSLQNFYEKCGFYKKGIEMRKDLF